MKIIDKESVLSLTGCAAKSGMSFYITVFTRICSKLKAVVHAYDYD